MSGFESFIRQRFGKLEAGKHAPDEGAACVLEAASAWRGLRWTDDPDALGAPDIRPLNDAPWPDDQERTEQMIRLYEAVADWAHWSAQRRARFVKRVALRTAREVVSEALRACGLEIEAANLARASTFAKVEALAYAAYATARDAARASARDAYADASAACYGVAHAAYAAARASARAAWERAAAHAVASSRAASASADAAHAAHAAARAAALATHDAADASARADAAGELLRRTVTLWVEAAHERRSSS
ncbi:MAG: hypothetical protein QW838_04125 [Candidatus Nitrosotenuis sp.]